MASSLAAATRLGFRRFAHQAQSTSPRHFLSIADLTPTEFATLVRNAASHKQQIKSGVVPRGLQGALSGKTVAMMFNKRSTRTRVSTEAAAFQMGGHPMFLGKDDIQLGVNESVYDTSVVISSMVSCIVARVSKHSDVKELAEHSTVPVINALCDSYHPLQTVADFLTIYESFAPKATAHGSPSLRPRRSQDRMATPKGYEIPADMLRVIQGAGQGKLTQTNVPQEAVKDADILVTDTWVSMGQEDESIKRLKAFNGFQITSELGKGAKENWKFMHCLPRHPEEVSDEVFYSPRSLVFPEAENRLWAAISALEGFVVNKAIFAKPNT
ncbi:hypothetical protein N7470_001184 [Penicillium chermesinum]|nr:hypothetical protein N7470_001184 [Penicillium chermesinum]